MGKYNGTSNNKTDTKVLYKKSNITIRTHSRTCSDASQVVRSGILQIKKPSSKTNDYYTHGDKVKRDLSVETGFCILRRYYKSKHKRDKCSVHASTGKSKCSTVADTEMDSGDDFKPDASACGDSRNKFEIVNQINPPKIDITAMMVENLKNLLNDLIRKHVLEDTETKKILINVLDNILHSLETRISSTRSSCSTYVVERNGEGFRVRNKKTATNSVTCQYCKQKQTSFVTNQSSSVLFRKYSRITIPFPYRHLRIISTLSIPRNLYRRDKVKKKDIVCKLKKGPKKNVAVPHNKKERRVIINVSSCETSTKKNVMKCSKMHEKKSQIKRGVIIVPQMLYKSTTEYTSTTEVEEHNNKAIDKKENHLDAMPSLVKSIYADDPANVTSTDKVTVHQKNDNFTMTEPCSPNVKIGNSISNVRFHQAKYECCKKNTKSNNNKITHDHSSFRYINQSIEFPNLAIPCHEISKYHRKSKFPTKYKLYRNFAKFSRRRRSIRKYEKIKHKDFNYLYKKTNNRREQENEFLDHFRNVFKYFASYKGKRNIKLEIHCNVYPLFDPEDNKQNSNFGDYHFQDNNRDIQDFELQVVAANDSDANTVKLDNAIEYDDKSQDSLKKSEINPESKPEIIPLLDGAVSQSKYIFKSDQSTIKSDDTLKDVESIDQGTVMTSLEVSKELKELKLAIKDLSATAERIVTEHLKRKREEKLANDLPNNVVKTNELSENTNEKLIKQSNLSKGIQISNTVAKGQLLSGIKLSKEPKKVEEFTNRLKKRSSSYHVIDSESILRVTDMTSSAIKPKSIKQPQIKKSKSLLQLTTEAHKQRLLAFFCDKNSCHRNDNLVYSIRSRGRRLSPKASPCRMQYCSQRSSPCNKKIFIPVSVSQGSFQGCNHEYCSSVYVDIDKPTITVKKKSGLKFWEGCLYCILLWIPLAVIIYLFYDYVLKDVFNKSGGSSTKTKMFIAEKKTPIPMTRNETKTSHFLLKLSDFGF